MFRIFFKHLPKNQTGQDLAEYGLLIGLIALAVVVAVGFLGDGLLATFTAIADVVNSW
jgi:Flp pilus assembly pilin Flp